MRAAVEFWFDFASTYSYPAAMRIEAAAARAGAPLAWKPFLLGPIFTEQLGIKDSPFNVFEKRGRYMWRDLERRCAAFGLPWRRPSVFPRNGIVAARLACLAAGEPWVPAFVRAVFGANFAEDREISDPAVLREILLSLGRDADALLAAAGAPHAKEALRAQTAEASRLGIFGAPNFVAAGELFFGHDRMDDALSWWSEGH
ncbi:MAG TPA: 2-hydroxychromene-2-carboxylate isomerase [Anaeromyxobacter sp.]